MSFVPLPNDLETLTATDPVSKRQARFAFRLWEGVASSVQSYSSTEVSGEGGGGSIGTMWGNVNGSIKPVTISSSTTHHMEVFITSDAGERTVKLENSGMSFRTGNRAAAHFVGLEEEEARPLFAVVNQDQDMMESYVENLDPAMRKSFRFKPGFYRSRWNLLLIGLPGRIATGFLLGAIYVQAYLALLGAPRGGTTEELIHGLPILAIVLWTMARLVTGSIRFLRRRRFLKALRDDLVNHAVRINCARLEARSPAAAQVAAE